MVNVLLINHEKKPIDKLLDYLSDFVVTVLRPDQISQDCDASFDFIVLSGGPINISGEQDIVQEKLLLRKTKLPVFGICLGMQIFGIIGGSPLLELPERRKGPISITLFGRTDQLYYNQGWFINQIPEGFEVLARDREIITAMKHKKKPFFGVQGHPERSGAFGRFILNEFMKEYVIDRQII